MAVECTELSSEQLEMLEECGRIGYSHAETAMVLEMALERFAELFEAKTELYKAYEKGRLLSEMTLRQRIFKDAENGSPIAMELALKFQKRQKILNNEQTTHRGYPR